MTMAIAGPFSGTTRAGITLSDIVAGLTMVEVVGALPVSGNFDGRFVFLTTDKKLYRFDGTAGAWITKVDGGDIIANSIVAGAIAAGAITAYAIGANLIITNTANIDNAVITGAKIALAEIGTGHLQNLAATTAKIDDLAVETLKIGDNAVTIPVSATTTGTQNVAGGGTQTMQSVNIDVAGPESVILLVCAQFVPVDNYTYEFRFVRNGTIIRNQSKKAPIIGADFVTLAFSDTPGAGNYTYDFSVYQVPSGASSNTPFSQRFMFAMTAKK